VTVADFVSINHIAKILKDNKNKIVYINTVEFQLRVSNTVLLHFPI